MMMMTSLKVVFFLGQYPGEQQWSCVAAEVR